MKTFETVVTERGRDLGENLSKFLRRYKIGGLRNKLSTN
jgi:hypothetical protein